MGQRHALGVSRTPGGVLDERELRGRLDTEEFRAAAGEGVHRRGYPQRRGGRAQQLRGRLELRIGQDESRLGTPQNPAVPLDVAVQVVESHGRIDRHGNPARAQRGHEGDEEVWPRCRQNRDPLSRYQAKVHHSRGCAPSAVPEFGVGQLRHLAVGRQEFQVGEAAIFAGAGPQQLKQGRRRARHVGNARYRHRRVRDRRLRQPRDCRLTAGRCISAELSIDRLEQVARPAKPADSVGGQVNPVGRTNPDQ